MSEPTQAVGAPLERQVGPLGWWARRRVNRLDVMLAGLRAKLAATNGAIRLVAEGSSIPGALVYDLRELPKLIAEMEETKRQIERPNFDLAKIEKQMNGDTEKTEEIISVTRRVEYAVDVQLRQLLGEAQKLATFASQILDALILEKDLPTGLSVGGEAHQQRQLANEDRAEKPT